MSVSVNFFNPLNTSVQVGDLLYYTEPLKNQSGHNHPTDPTSTGLILLGEITQITHGIPPAIFTMIGSAAIGTNTITLSGTNSNIVPTMGVAGLGIVANDTVTSITGNNLVIGSNTTLDLVDEIITFSTTPALEVSVITVGVPLSSTVYGAYYFFSKNNSANLTSLVGYYAEVEIRNNSTTEAEIYRLTTDFSQSSR